MKLKILITILALTVASVAQTTSTIAPSSTTPDAKSCACCNHEGSSKAGMGCCKNGKCSTMSGGHAATKCPMVAKN